MLFFFIPFLSLVSNSELFLIINTFAVLFRFTAFVRNNLLLNRIIDFLIGSVWIIHHSIFVTFFVYKDKNLNENEISLIINLGIGAILTVTAIIILQIFKYIIFVMMSLKYCYRLLKSSQ